MFLDSINYKYIDNLLFGFGICSVLFFIKKLDL